ncbi:hypothetical protein [Candidatus Williamhamiltonella defendens]|uniref:hypothetical protein n=1 Tax=Candidatus Williamhamiltonella defendens TaxID=138072 RepID=UPI00130E6759|nr:hypothetical protein [Candidatus Hamiltonella defensa]
MVGHIEKRNIVDTGDGIKNFKRGYQSNTFIFTSTVLPEKSSAIRWHEGFGFFDIEQKAILRKRGILHQSTGKFPFTDSS